MASDGGSPPAGARALLESQEDIEPPIRRRRYTNDSTIEKLGQLLIQNPNGMLDYRDEIHGFLKTIDSESRPKDRSFYLEGWNGTGVLSVRPHWPWDYGYQASRYLTIRYNQPGRIASYIHNAVRKGSGDDGFSQRFQLAVYGDELRVWKNVDRYPNNDASNAVYAIIQQLAAMAETDEPAILQFCPAAAGG